MCKDTFEIKRVLLEWIVCAKVHLRSRLTWIDWGARGIFSLKGLDRHQQCQDICGSNYLFRSTRKKQRCCDDFAWELATFVQTLNHHLGDERIGYGVGNGMFDAQDVQDEGEGTPRWRCHNCGTSRQSRQSILTQNIKTCYDCGKLGHITCFCYKAKNNNKDNANNTKDGDDHTFARQHIVHSKAMYKFIMDLGASNHMTSHRVALDTYKVFSSCNVYLSYDSIMETIWVGSIVVEMMMKGKIKTICIKVVFHVPKLQTNLLSVSKLLRCFCQTIIFALQYEPSHLHYNFMILNTCMVECFFEQS